MSLNGALKAGDALLRGRFRIQRELGRGGFGVVYEAIDEALGARVALKVLTDSDPEALYTFKREFRALADVSHPHLVTLHELFVEDGTWFFTMELIEGVDFLAWVGAGVEPGEATDTAVDATASDVSDAPTLSLRSPSEEAALTHAGDALAGSGVDEDRLRSALAQLVRAVASLHRGGWVHFDLKPRNVLVDGAGRLKVLDFGLAQPRARLEQTQTVPGLGRPSELTLLDAGTPAYIAPEKLTGEEVGPPADWYAVGVMLFAALTGRTPFAHHRQGELKAKVTQDAPRVLDTDPGAPADLAELADRLLARRPVDRPRGEDLVARLSEPLGERTDRSPVGRGAAGLLLGRQRELDRLERALVVTEVGRPGLVVLRGASGAGKSALLEHFLDRLALERGQEGPAWGRCFEYERVPFNALDALVDRLVRHERTRRRPAFAELDAGQRAAVARVFPVVGQLGLSAPPPGGATHEGAERALAVDGWVAWLDALAKRDVLAVGIDDLQWADDDSLELLTTALRRRTGLRLLVVATLRGDVARGREMLARLQASGVVLDVVDVGPLDEGDAAQLVRALLPGVQDERALALARDCQGQPFLIDQLVVAPGVSRAEEGGAASVDLPSALTRRIEHLAADQRAFLEALCLAGRPLSDRVVARAAHVEDALGSARPLQAQRLLRSAAPGQVEPYHDRVRQAVLGALAPRVATELHRALAEALIEEGARGGTASADAIARHLEEGGSVRRAAGYWVEAGDLARASLAFTRAAEFYARALELGEPGPALRRDLLVRQGESHVAAGGGVAAARCFLAAADLGGAGVLALRARAAEAASFSGAFSTGAAIYRDLAGALGTPFPATRTGLLASLAALAIQARQPVSAFLPSEQRADEAGRLRLDAFFSAAVGLGAHDSLSALWFQLHHRRDALGHGGTDDRVRALVLACATAGIRSRPERVRALLERGGELAAASRDPVAAALIDLGGAMASLYLSQFEEAVARGDRAAPVLREHVSRGLHWALDLALCFATAGRVALGHVGELRRRAPELDRDARARGERDILWNVPTGAHWVRLADDDPDGDLDELARRAPEEAAQTALMRLTFAAARSESLVYRGRPSEALDTLDAAERELAGLTAPVLRIRFNRLRLATARLRAWMAVGPRNDRARWHRTLKRGAAAVVGLGEATPRGVGLLALARVAQDLGRLDDARRHLELARAVFAAHGSRLNLAAALHGLADLIGGDEGEEHRGAASTLLEDEGVVRPEGVLRVVGYGPSGR